MSHRIDVFISSTSNDLEAYRNEVIKVVLKLGMYPIAMEAFGATERNAMQLCYDKVSVAEIFIGIYAHRYGYVPDESINYMSKDGKERYGDSRTSITHWEYIWAIERNLPIFLYIVDEKISWNAEHIANGLEKEQLDLFKEIIGKKHVWNKFYSPDHLATQVATSLLIEDLLSHPSELIIQESTVKMPRIVGETIMDTSVYFRDRDIQYKEILNLLIDTNTRIISIIGRGGIGKTALVNKVLSDLSKSAVNLEGNNNIKGVVYLSTRRKGISLERIFLDCADLFEEERHDEIIAIWINTQLNTHQKVLKLLEKFRNGIHVIFLDNMEDLIDQNREVKDLDLRTFFEVILRSPQNCRLLITTREPLLFPKEVMAFDKRIIIQEGLPQTEAIALLRDLDPHGEYGLRNADERLLKEVTSMVHGVPRALEVVASILSHDPFIQLEDLISKDALFNHSEFVEALVRENYKKLDTGSRYIVEVLSVFRSPASLDTIRFLLSPFVSNLNVQEVLAYLIQTHTVSFDRQTKLVSLHPIDRDYIYSQLPFSGLYNRKGLEMRVATYYQGISLPESEWEKIEDVLPKIKECEHLILADEFKEAYANIPYKVLYQWGYYDSLLKLYLEVADKITDPSLQKLCFTNIANIMRRSGQLNQALKYYTKSLEITQSYKLQGESDYLAWMAHCYFDLVDIDNARSLYEQAKTLDEKDQNIVQVAQRLRSLGWCVKHIGEIDLALEYIHKSLDIVQNIDSAQNEQATALFSLAQIDLDIGNHLDAEKKLQKSLAIFTSLGESVWVFYVKLIMGELMIQRGDFKDGLQLLSSLAIYVNNIKDVYILYHLCEKMARTHLYLGELISAYEFTQRGRLHSYPRDNHNLIVLEGIILLNQKRFADASVCFNNAIIKSDELLSRNNRYYSALSTKSLACAGLAECGNTEMESQGIAIFQYLYQLVTTNRNNAQGIIKHFKDMFNLIIKNNQYNNNLMEFKGNLERFI